MNNSPTPARKAIAAMMAFTMAMAPLGPGAFAAVTVLADIPIAAKVAAKPNLLYTFDDSGSMSLPYIPDYVVTNSYCRSTAGNNIAACGTGFSRGMHEPMFASEFNKLYYNPNLNYEPPVDGAGNQSTAAAPNAAAAFPYMDSGNTAAWTVVRNDQYLAPAGTATDIAAPVPTWVFCNTDWPRTAYVGALDATSWSEIGNANGEYAAGTGADCRINGTSYDLVDGADAVDDDYNYPYFRSTGSVNNANYFYRSGMINNVYRYRHLWCKTGAAGWPKSATNLGGCGAYTCTLGGTPVVPATVTQTCNFTGNINGAPYSYTGTPAIANCNTNPAYQWTWTTGGCVGTIGVECFRCDRSTTVTARNAVCSVTGVSCGTTGAPAPAITVNGNAACPDQPGTTPTSCTVGVLVPPAPCNPLANANCNMTYGGTGGTGGSTLLDDANGAGVTCRHNNSTGAYISTRFTYPEAGAVVPTKWNKAVNDASCGVIPRRVDVPRYYNTVVSVQFCDLQQTTAVYNNTQWRGFGRGTCKSKNDFATYRYPLYGKFTRVGIVNDGRTFAYTDPFSGVSGTRTYAEEMTNFSNWHAYYRTRVLAAKTTTSIAFNIVDNTYRAGFHTMNSPTTNWLDAGDFDAAQRAAWYAKLFGVTIATAKTPTLDAMLRIGQLVENGAGAVTGLPVHTDPIPTIAGNPVTCTNNYHILFTDGYTDQIALPAVAGEVDGSNVPAPSATVLPSGPVTNPERTVASLQALAGSPWPRPYKDAAVPTANTLADIALYYWMRDLRPTMLNDVPASDGRAGADLDWTRNPAFWQHVSFSALSYGSDGLLDASNVVGVTNAIQAGTSNWFTAPNYPAPPNNALFPASNPRAVTADDLWHATVNSRGKFVFAETPIEIAYGLGSIISGVGNNRKARVGASFASRNLSATNNFIFQATIEPGWSGELKKLTIDTTTAVTGATRWSAGVKLSNLLATPAPGTSPLVDADNAWFLNRKVVTRNIDSGVFAVVPFRFADLTTGPNTQLNTLAITATNQQKVISYLRGGSTFGPGPTPQLIEGTAIGQYRARSGKLGNISDSKPVIVGPASRPFTDAADFGYPAYKALYAARDLRVYVGANDGMFHVFNGMDDSGPNTGGTEMYAYIPSSVFTNAFDEGGKARKGIRALTFQDGGAPIFKHHFYVNATPRTQDVDFANCGSNSACGGANWRTIVVSGMGKGGNTYFAIDATDTAVADEAGAASKILWEFQLPNSEFSFGNPIIAKTRADGWVVIVASGYNNTDGKGHLYFLDARTGLLIRTLNTTGADSGTPANPSGLTKISGFVKNDADQTIEQIYGGDLLGRVWRWDVSDADGTTWQAKTVLLANLTDPSGVAQPVTTVPELEIDINNGVDRFVFVGTGRLLDATDLTSPSPEQIQTAYAIRDGTLDTPLTAGLPIAPRASLASAAGIAGVAGAAPNGWYNDLPAGQRIVVDPVAEFNIFSYAGTVLQPDPCLTSLPAYIYARDYVSAESLVYTGGVQTLSYYSASGAVGLELLALEDPTKTFKDITIVFSPETGADPIPVTIKPKTFGGGHRLSWRLLGD